MAGGLFVPLTEPRQEPGRSRTRRRRLASYTSLARSGLTAPLAVPRRFVDRSPSTVRWRTPSAGDRSRTRAGQRLRDVPAAAGGHAWTATASDVPESPRTRSWAPRRSPAVGGARGCAAGDHPRRRGTQRPDATRNVAARAADLQRLPPNGTRTVTSSNETSRFQTVPGRGPPLRQAHLSSQDGALLRANRRLDALTNTC